MSDTRKSITGAELFTIIQPLKIMSQAATPFMSSIAISRTLKRVQAEAETIEEERKELRSRLAKTNEEGDVLYQVDPQAYGTVKARAEIDEDDFDNDEELNEAFQAARMKHIRQAPESSTDKNLPYVTEYAVVADEHQAEYEQEIRKHNTAEYNVVSPIPEDEIQPTLEAYKESLVADNSVNYSAGDEDGSIPAAALAGVEVMFP